MSKRKWTDDEDKELERLVQSTGQSLEAWKTISALFPQRNAKQCRERYQSNLNPALETGPWSLEEERLLFQLQASVGNAWTNISAFLPGRSEAAVKNRYYSALRRVERAHRLHPTMAGELLALHARTTMTQEEASVVKGFVHRLHSHLHWHADEGAGQAGSGTSSSLRPSSTDGLSTVTRPDTRATDDRQTDRQRATDALAAEDTASPPSHSDEVPGGQGTTAAPASTSRTDRARAASCSEDMAGEGGGSRSGSVVEGRTRAAGAPPTRGGGGGGGGKRVQFEDAVVDAELSALTAALAASKGAPFITPVGNDEGASSGTRRKSRKIRHGGGEEGDVEVHRGAESTSSSPAPAETDGVHARGGHGGPLQGPVLPPPPRRREVESGRGRMPSSAPHSRRATPPLAVLPPPPPSPARPGLAWQGRNPAPASASHEEGVTRGELHLDGLSDSSSFGVGVGLGLTLALAGAVHGGLRMQQGGPLHRLLSSLSSTTSVGQHLPGAVAPHATTAASLRSHDAPFGTLMGGSQAAVAGQPLLPPLPTSHASPGTALRGQYGTQQPRFTGGQGQGGVGWPGPAPLHYGQGQGGVGWPGQAPLHYGQGQGGAGWPGHVPLHVGQGQGGMGWPGQGPLHVGQGLGGVGWPGKGPLHVGQGQGGVGWPGQGPLHVGQGQGAASWPGQGPFYDGQGSAGWPGQAHHHVGQPGGWVAPLPQGPTDSWGR